MENLDINYQLIDDLFLFIISLSTTVSFIYNSYDTELSNVLNLTMYVPMLLIPLIIGYIYGIIQHNNLNRLKGWIYYIESFFTYIYTTVNQSISIENLAFYIGYTFITLFVTIKLWRYFKLKEDSKKILYNSIIYSFMISLMTARFPLIIVKILGVNFWNYLPVIILDFAIVILTLIFEYFNK